MTKSRKSKKGGSGRSFEDLTAETKRRTERRKREFSRSNNGAFQEDPRPDLIIHSRRGKQLTTKGPCDYCQQTYAPRWRYSRSTWGEIVLCTECKIKAFEKSGRSAEASTYRVPGSTRQ